MADEEQTQEPQTTLPAGQPIVTPSDEDAPDDEAPDATRGVNRLDLTLPNVAPDDEAAMDETIVTAPVDDALPNDEAQALSVVSGALPAMAAPGATAVTSPRHGAPKHSASGISGGHRLRRRVLVAIAVVVGGLALVYAGGVLVFSQFLFLPGTSINGQSVSLVATSEVAAEHQEQLSGYELEVTGKGLDFDITSSDVALATDGEAFVRRAQAELNAWMWPYLAFQQRNLAIETLATFDEAAASRIVDEQVAAANVGSTPPVNASVELNAASGRYEVVGGTPGTEIDPQAVSGVVSEALRTFAPALTISEDQLVLPEILADDERLANEASTLNTYVDATQTLTVAGNDVFAVGGAQIAQWLVIGEDHSVSINADAVTAWTRGDLSSVLDSIGSTRSYTRPDGKAIQVSGGTYGWSIDGSALAATMVANIQAGTAATIEVPMLETAAVWNPGGADWGARYIDIDLSEQYVRFYDEGGAIIWESACVSGNVAENHATPTGVYYVNGNMATGDVELRGLIDPATNEPEYISHVTYWMPFVDNAIALHDANWRSSFGGSIYQYNGSHGCVNLPTDAAATLYGIVRVGDVVVTHG